MYQYPSDNTQYAVVWNLWYGIHGMSILWYNKHYATQLFGMLSISGGLMNVILDEVRRYIWYIIRNIWYIWHAAPTICTGVCMVS